MVHRQAGTDQSKHFRNAARIPDDARRQQAAVRIGDFGEVDVACPFKNFACDFSDSAQFSIEERCLDQVVQSGRDEQPFQCPIQEDAEVAALIDQSA